MESIAWQNKVYYIPSITEKSQQDEKITKQKKRFVNLKVTSKYPRIKDKSETERPREKMIRYGKQALSNAELLGLILGSGIESMNSVDLASHILKSYNHEVANLANCSFEELQRFKGIGPAKAVLILSALELSQRIDKAAQTEKPKIESSYDIYKIMKKHFIGKAIEECWVLLLNNDFRVLNTIQISKGGLSRTHVDPSVILRQVIIHNSTQFVILHNHPSGNPEPSKADIGFTRRLQQAAIYTNTELLDHLIMTPSTYFSFKDQGMLMN